MSSHSYNEFAVPLNPPVRISLRLNLTHATAAIFRKRAGVQIENSYMWF